MTQRRTEFSWRDRWTRLVGAAQHDFCPWANRYVYWSKQPIGWFVIAAAGSLLVGMFLGPQGYVYFAAIMAVIALGVAWPWLAMRGLSCQMRFDRRTTSEGNAVRVIVTITNRWFMPAWGLGISRGMQREDAEHPLFVSLSLVMPWSQTEFEWEFTPSQRGEYPLVQPQISTGFPFGLWECRQPVSVPAVLTVWPRSYTVAEWPQLIGPARSLLGALAPRTGHEGDVQALRPFRQGDSWRDVHWPQTARQGELIVRERHAPCRREALIVIDAMPEHHLGQGADHSFEWALRVAASLTRELHRQLFAVECRIGESVAQLPVQAACLSPIMNTLAVAVMDARRELLINDVDRAATGLRPERRGSAAPDVGGGGPTPRRLTFLISTNLNSQFQAENLRRGNRIPIVLIDARACGERAATPDCIREAWRWPPPATFSWDGDQAVRRGAAAATPAVSLEVNSSSLGGVAHAIPAA